MKTIVGILIVAAVSTASDYVWYEIGVRSRMSSGILTGAVMLMAVGGVFGWMANRVAAGMVMGVVAGVTGALAYYALVRSVSATAAMLAAWAVVWIVLAVGDARVIRRPARPLGDGFARGLAAAVLSGLTFYLVSDELWGFRGSRNYAIQYAHWLLAWAPGIIAIAWRR